MIGASGNGSTNASTATSTTTVTTTAAGSQSTATVTTTATVTKTVTNTKTVQANIQAGHSITDGMWKVGTDIKPGTYKTKVPADSSNCYWARLSAADTSAIIDNNNVDAGSTAYVTIAASDKYFDSEGCGTWQMTK